MTLQAKEKEIRFIFIVAAAAALCSCAALCGCSQTAFSPHFQDNEVRDVQAAMKDFTVKSGAPANGQGRPLVFAVTGSPTQIVAYDLSASKVLWRAPADVASRLTVGRDHIFYRSGDNQIIGRAISDGRAVWSKRMTGGERLLGITADGEMLYYATERAEKKGDEVAYLVALDGRNGRTRWTQESGGRLGAPMAHGGKIFLPLRYQAIAVLDAATGVEQARIRSKDESLLWVTNSGNKIVYGSKSGIYQFDESSASGGVSKQLAAELPPPVRANHWWDGYNAALSYYTAYDRQRMLWQISPDDFSFADDSVYFHYYRFIFAFDAARQGQGQGQKLLSKLKWVHNVPRHDVVSSAHVGRSLVLITDDGQIIVLDLQTGQPIAKHQLKAVVRGATIDAQGYAPAMAKRPEGGDVRRALTEVIWDPDRRFNGVKLFCIEQLSKLPGGDITQDLVNILMHEGVPPAVFKRAGDVLVERRDKKSVPIYLKALERQYNYAEGSEPKAVGVMARALGELKEQSAVPLLIKHLQAPETPATALEEIVSALIKIGDNSAVPHLRSFLLTYRSDAQFTGDTQPLTMAAQALLALGGENEYQVLSFIENDKVTLPALRQYLRAALHQPRADKQLVSKSVPEGADQTPRPPAASKSQAKKVKFASPGEDNKN